ncbi:MAG: O-acetyl-ADP-ribose deacetylase [Chloroflexaceae bacterium]|nr:O-acetyl-ADP-ribose deacetylase [Chloroflexaceae bacterium]
MQRTIGGAVLELVQGDITLQEVDALFNAANSRLMGGGGVDGAIHRAGGPALLEACRQLAPCPTGEARLTTAGNLKAQYVIHAVGPIYQRDPANDAALLSSAYRSSLELASYHGIRRLAFPSLSTGAYGYPIDEAAPVALSTVITYLQQHPEIELVRFVLFDSRTFDAYQQALASLLKP